MVIFIDSFLASLRYVLVLCAAACRTLQPWYAISKTLPGLSSSQFSQAVDKLILRYKTGLAQVERVQASNVPQKASFWRSNIVTRKFYPRFGIRTKRHLQSQQPFWVHLPEPTVKNFLSTRQYVLQAIYIRHGVPFQWVLGMMTWRRAARVDCGLDHELSPENQSYFETNEPVQARHAQEHAALISLYRELWNRHPCDHGVTCLA